MRDGKICNLRGTVPGLRHLSLQWLGRNSVSLADRNAGRLEGTVWYYAHIPCQSPFGMRDEKARRSHHVGDNLVPLKPEALRIDNVQDAAIEHIEPHRLRRLCVTLLSHRWSHCGGQHGQRNPS